MDIVQLTIIIISIVLTLLVVVLGVQMWFILKEVRSSFQKANKMLEDFGKVTGSVGEGVANLSGLVSGMKAGLSVFSALHKRGGKDD